MSPEHILVSVGLAVTGWTLLMVVGLKADMAAVKQQLKDLERRERE